MSYIYLDKYFKEVISNQFEQENPKQILFSFIAENICVGYGGLVHINWVDKNAEVSFVMNTELEKNNFEEYWGIFLNLIEEVTFTDLQLHKLYIYAFDLRPHLYKALENFKYKEVSNYYKSTIQDQYKKFDYSNNYNGPRNKKTYKNKKVS